MGFAIRKHCQVAYIQCDTPHNLWAERVERLQEEHGCDFSNVFFASLNEIPYPFYFNAPDGSAGVAFDWVKEVLLNPTSDDGAPFNPKVLIIDTIRESHDGDENDSAHMQKVIALMKAAALPDMGIVLVSHSRKNDPMRGKSLMDDNRGSGYVAGRMDCVMRISEKQMAVKGRTISETIVSVTKDDDGFFELADPVIGRARELLLRHPTEETRKIAQLLQKDFHDKSYEACRSIIRRMRTKETESGENLGDEFVARHKRPGIGGPSAKEKDGPEAPKGTPDLRLVTAGAR